MRKADKLFQLTNLIRARQPITASEIANELNVSVRTVYRYIDDLSVSQIPIFGTAGVGYQLDEKFELPPLNLTEKELDALIVGVKMVSSWTGDELSDSASSLANKIEAVLPKKLREEYKRTIFAPKFSGRKKDRDTWESLHKAIKNSKIVSIDYTALNGNKTFRMVYPLGLFYWGGKWTLGGWCTLKQDFRNFRTDRINHAVVEAESFVQSDSINLQSYLDSMRN